MLRKKYLKNSCKAGALNFIEFLPISVKNYGIAWDALVERYSNKKYLINAVI